MFQTRPRKTILAGTKLFRFVILLMVLSKLHFHSRPSPTPIDLVYLWVNGSDPSWNIVKKRLETMQGITSRDAVGSERFLEYDELRYSMRSVSQYAPWIHLIYLVTNGQVPHWLNTHHPKIRLVTHQQIMDADSLPTFNSYAIEANLHKIPDLSEKFLFSNDDFYLWDTVTSDDFFDEEGLPMVRIAHKTIPESLIQREQYIRNIVYSGKLIEERFHRNVQFEPSHTIMPYRKSIYSDCANVFPTVFNFTSHQQFRGENNVHRSIVTYYGIITNRTRVLSQKDSDNTCIYMKICSPDKMKSLLRTRNAKFVCINDGPTVRQEDREQLPQFLEHYFPNPATWEINNN